MQPVRFDVIVIYGGWCLSEGVGASLCRSSKPGRRSVHGCIPTLEPGNAPRIDSSPEVGTRKGYPYENAHRADCPSLITEMSNIEE